MTEKNTEIRTVILDQNIKGLARLRLTRTINLAALEKQFGDKIPVEHLRDGGMVVLDIDPAGKARGRVVKFGDNLEAGEAFVDGFALADELRRRPRAAKPKEKKGEGK